MIAAQSQGLAFSCDLQGLIQRVLRNDLNLEKAAPDQLFIDLMESASRAKAADFLTEIKSQGAVLDWEMNVPTAHGILSLHFSGGLAGESLLITAGVTSSLAARIYYDLFSINNEQTNRLRAALKENMDLSRIVSDPMFDEISRLNNELVSMQRELSKKNAELERLNREKNRFLGMAAHDLRNPLYAIMSHSEFLLDEDPLALGADYREFIQVIYASSEFMARLVDDLLDVAKIEAGQLHLDYAAVDLRALVARNVSINRVLAAKKQVNIDVQAESIPKAVVDIAKLEQVLNNLLGNAVKFSPPGARVEVRLAGQARDFILSVHDQGAGISPEEIGNLFKPFQPGQKGTQGEKSTGLGLVIVKRIVEGHGGKIWLESQVGQGTTFFVSIPFEPPETFQEQK